MIRDKKVQLGWVLLAATMTRTCLSLDLTGKEKAMTKPQLRSIDVIVVELGAPSNQQTLRKWKWTLRRSAATIEGVSMDEQKECIWLMSACLGPSV